MSRLSRAASGLAIGGAALITTGAQASPGVYRFTRPPLLAMTQNSPGVLSFGIHLNRRLPVIPGTRDGVEAYVAIHTAGGTAAPSDLIAGIGSIRSCYAGTFAADSGLPSALMRARPREQLTVDLYVRLHGNPNATLVASERVPLRRFARGNPNVIFERAEHCGRGGGPL